MTNTVKNTLKSVIALSVVAVVCVALLAVANAFIPKYKPTLDANTAALINKVSPTGVSDNEAFIGGYFEMYDISDSALNDFNKANGAEVNNKVLAVYSIVKGNNKGTYAVEAQAQGYSGNDPIILITSFNRDNSIMSTTVKSQNENSPGSAGIFTDRYFNALITLINGKTSISTDEVMASTGATSRYSINGVVNALNISQKMVSSMDGSQGENLSVQDVTDTSLISKLKKLSSSGSVSFKSYTVSSEHSSKIAALYKGNGGDVFITGKGTGWQPMEILFAFSGDKIAALTIVKNNEDIANTNSANKYEFKDATVAAALVGKNLADVNSMSTDNFLANTGATVSHTASGIKSCVVGALEFLPSAQQYIAQIEEGANG